MLLHLVKHPEHILMTLPFHEWQISEIWKPEWKDKEKVEGEHTEKGFIFDIWLGKVQRTCNNRFIGAEVNIPMAYFGTCIAKRTSNLNFLFENEIMC